MKPEELKSLPVEIRRDEQAARTRDYGPEDAATYPSRVREGADSVRHLDPVIPMPDAAELERTVEVVERGWSTFPTPPDISRHMQERGVRYEDHPDAFTEAARRGSNKTFGRGQER
jgi:hypothetical protein